MTRDDIIEYSISVEESELHMVVSSPHSEYARINADGSCWINWDECRKAAQVWDEKKVVHSAFAKLLLHVAAAERDRMIAEGYRQCAEGQRVTQHCGLLEDAVKAEREACAKMCEEIKCGMWEESKKHRDTRLRDASDGAGACTYAIRARGEP